MSIDFFTVFIVICLVVIFLALGSALWGLICPNPKHPKRTVRSLTIRIGLSLSIFFMLFIAFYMGWITPHGL